MAASDGMLCLFFAEYLSWTPQRLAIIMEMQFPRGTQGRSCRPGHDCWVVKVATPLPFAAVKTPAGNRFDKRNEQLLAPSNDGLVGFCSYSATRVGGCRASDSCGDRNLRRWENPRQDGTKGTSSE